MSYECFDTNDESEFFSEYKDAVQMAERLADEWDTEHPDKKLDRGYASQDNMYCCYHEDYCVQVVRGEE